MNVQKIQELNATLTSNAESLLAQAKREEDEIAQLEAVVLDIVGHITVKRSQAARMRETAADMRKIADEAYVAPEEAPVPKAFLRPQVNKQAAE